MKWLRGLLGSEGIPIRVNPEGCPEPTAEQRAAMLRVPAERPEPPKVLAVAELASAAAEAAAAASGKRPYKTPELVDYGDVRRWTRSGGGSRREEFIRRRWK